MAPPSTTTEGDNDALNRTNVAMDTSDQSEPSLFFMSTMVNEKDAPVTNPSDSTTTTTLASTNHRPDIPNTTQSSSSSLTSPKNKNELVETMGKAAWQMGSDFFVALRWGAANALTASLPENQRQILLDRLDATVSNDGNTNGPDDDDDDGIVIETTTPNNNNNDDDDGYDRVTNSINEAVVASMVTKSQRNEPKWDRDKEQLMVQAEIAAQKRVATELAIQQQRYDAELQRLAVMEANQSDDDDDDDNELDDDDDTIAAVRHPVLGPVLYDFGYKRLHLVPADVLATIPVWKKQRTYRQERAKSMAVDKMKSLHLGFPGVICIHEERSTGKIAIIDGQHRVGMMKILQEKQQQQQTMSVVDGDNPNNSTTTGLNFIDLDHVLVEVYTETEPYPSTNKDKGQSGGGGGGSSIKDHAQDLFTEINKAEPVKLVDMPGVATSKERKMISQACARLEEQYQIMFKPSQKCRPPNVNIDNLRDTIFASNILKRHNIQSSSQLYDWLIQQNSQMGSKYTNDDDVTSSLNDKVWNKAQTNDFYLGLDSSWFYN